MNIEVICETGPPGYHPYPRRLESLTIADVITKAALSPQLFKDPECWPGRNRTHDLPRGSPVLNQLSDHFNNSFNFKIQKSFSDSNGRFIICDIETEKKCITIATVYAPNEDDPQFFTSFFDQLMDFECEEIVVGGDFNLVLNVNVDKKGGLARTHSNSQEALKNLAAQFDLIDA